jgi:hypothetical protein
MEDRIKKPKLPRTTPLRSLSALFAPMPSNGAATGGAVPGATEPWSDVVTRSVELGYRVIDDYVRQGERMARAVSERGPGGMASPGDAQEVATRMAQYAMDFTGLWLQMLQTASVAANGWPTPPFPGWGTMSGAPTRRRPRTPCARRSPRANRVRTRRANPDRRPA